MSISHVRLSRGEFELYAVVGICAYEFGDPRFSVNIFESEALAVERADKRRREGEKNVQIVKAGV